MASYAEKENYITRDSNPDAWRSHPNYHLMRFYKFLIKGAVADLGTNHGATTFLLLDLIPDRPIESINGYDINGAALKVANNTTMSINPSIPVTFTEANLLNLPVADASFDFAMSFHTLEHIYPKDADAFVKEVFRILKSDTYFLISIPYMKAYPDPCHVAFYNVESLCELFEKHGFEVIECMRDNRWNEKELLTAVFRKP